MQLTTLCYRSYTALMMVVLVFLLVQLTMKYLSSLQLNSPNFHRPQGTIPDYLGVPLGFFPSSTTSAYDKMI